MYLHVHTHAVIYACSWLFAYFVIFIRMLVGCLCCHCLCLCLRLFVCCFVFCLFGCCLCMFFGGDEVLLFVVYQFDGSLPDFCVIDSWGRLVVSWCLLVVLPVRCCSCLPLLLIPFLGGNKLPKPAMTGQMRKLGKETAILTMFNSMKADKLQALIYNMHFIIRLSGINSAWNHFVRAGREGGKLLQCPWRGVSSHGGLQGQILW